MITGMGVLSDSVREGRSPRPDTIRVARPPLPCIYGLSPAGLLSGLLQNQAKVDSLTSSRLAAMDGQAIRAFLK